MLPWGAFSMAEEPRVLIVEDDASMRRATGRLLRAAGFHCVEYDSAEALLRSEDLDAWDCLVTDIRLPGLSGFALLDTVRRLRPGMPVVLMTAYEEQRTRDQALQKHRVAFLVKPFEGVALLEAIRKVTLVDLI
jgi:FixJ family two-component response regulator